MYLERDPAAAVVATQALALDQREVVTCPMWQSTKLVWRPQEPADKAFELLNPGTTGLGTMFLLGGNSTATPNVQVGFLTVEVWATIRGRP